MPVHPGELVARLSGGVNPPARQTNSRMRLRKAVRRGTQLGQCGLLSPEKGLTASTGTWHRSRTDVGPAT